MGQVSAKSNIWRGLARIRRLNGDGRGRLQNISETKSLHDAAEIILANAGATSIASKAFPS
jgi:hypothetical protein